MQINNLNLNPINYKSKASSLGIKTLKKTTSEIATTLIENEKAKLEFERDILQLLLKGFSLSEVAEKKNVSLYLINKISAKYNAHKIYMQRREEIILDKLLNNKSRKTVVKEMDISKKVVQDVAEKYGVFKQNTEKRDELIIEKIKSGMKQIDIAKELGISENTVGRTVKKMGYKYE